MFTLAQSVSLNPYSNVTNNILLPIFALAVNVMLIFGALHSRGNQEHIGLLLFVAAVAALALPLALVIFNNVGSLTIGVPALP
jgi:tellurite resistance protein TehA-like permease